MSCCGAVDGHLTSAGILSAFLGLGLTALLPGWGREGSVIAYAALTLVATSSGAVCMGIGQIWSSALAADAAEDERVFHSDQARSKACLVDALMVSGGMLKIDAVSLAETLEGYPDLFVSALLGGGGICSEEEEEDSGRDGESKEEDGGIRYW